MKKIYIFLGFLVLFSVVGTIRNWQTNDWEALFKNPLPKFESIKTEQLPDFFSAQETVGYQEFITQDGKFKMKYPASWLTLENQGLLATAAPKEWQEKYNLKTIFLAQYFKAGKFAQLMMQEGVFDIPAGEIIEEMKKINQNQGWELEVVKSDIQDDKAVFEARYLTANSPNLYSKEEVLLVGGKTYLIAFVTLEKDWPEFSEQADVILESIKISL